MVDITKEQLFKKYSIDATHYTWDPVVDNWMSVEIYRTMNGGELPEPDNMDVTFVCDFLDKRKDLVWWAKNVMSQSQWGSLFLTAKRMVARHADEMLIQLAATKGGAGG